MKLEDIKERFTQADEIYKISSFIDDVAKQYFTDYDGRVYAVDSHTGWTRQISCNLKDLKALKAEGFDYIVWYTNK